VDFYCAEARLAIEVDGGIHAIRQEEDAVRQAYLERMGISFLRFSNEDVLRNLETVLMRLRDAVHHRFQD
jgi:very-short-patch-repair endonuclease